MTTATLTLTDFLLARIAEDEAVAARGLTCDQVHPTADVWHPDGHPSPRAERECAAKRRIIERMQQAVDDCDGPDNIELTPWLQDAILRDLASVYADHPDYDDAWR